MVQVFVLCRARLVKIHPAWHTILLQILLRWSMRVGTVAGLKGNGMGGGGAGGEFVPLQGM
jgi:hypothetical protein